MRLVDVLRYLLAIVALAGLVAGWPLAAPSAAMAHMSSVQVVDDTSMSMDRMDCHHAKRQTAPGCGQLCPWAGLCAPSLIPARASIGVSRFALAYTYTSQGDRRLDERTEPPPARPPRS